MRGPPGVADARRAGVDPGERRVLPGALLGQRLLQVGQLAGTLAYQQRAGPRAGADDRHTGRVVTAVLQAPQAVQHDTERRSGARIPHDSAHVGERNPGSLKSAAQKADFCAAHLSETTWHLREMGLPHGACRLRLPKGHDGDVTATPPAVDPLVERMRPFGTTIFAEMSALAVRTGSVNLGQGFPDTDGPPEMLAAAQEAIAAGHN